MSVQVVPPLADYEYGTTFQYILCVGSRNAVKNGKMFAHKFQYILCVGSSIEDELEQSKWKEFQYILCVGSSTGKIKILQETYKFQYILCVGSSWQNRQKAPKEKRVSIHPMCRFKPFTQYSFPFLYNVSIHPMCRFKLYEIEIAVVYLSSFNTSYVSVQVSLLLRVTVCLSVFQYILCVGSREI